MDKKYILDKLSQIDKNKYSISELGLFGSYAKDNADDNSDIDILVKLEFKKGMYQNFCELQKELEKIFNRKVDLIEKGTFDYEFKNNNVREYKEKIKEEILASNEIHYIGDGITNSELVFSGKEFFKVLEFLFENVPEHHYFFDEDKRWCLLIATEGWIAYGEKTCKNNI